MELHKLINQMGPENAEATLLRCCGSKRWAGLMADRRPFLNDAAVYSSANEIWSALEESDYLEAFSHHPEIGSNVEELRKKYASTAGWSSGEQSGMQTADEQTIQTLATGNQEYRKKFGFVFLICATGKSAREMLEALEDRLPHDRAQEIAIAAGEQAKITKIRLKKLAGEQ